MLTGAIHVTGGNLRISASSLVTGTIEGGTIGGGTIEGGTIADGTVEGGA